MDYNKLADILFPNITKDVAFLEEKFPKRDLPKGAEVTRYAPSPTGRMHLGGLFGSLIDFTIAHQTGGVVYLRIEDTDKVRELEGGVEEIVSSLKKFGMVFDEGVTGENSSIGNYGPYVQSQRKEIYQICAKDLVRRGLAYPCFCTAEDLDSLRKYQEENKLDIGYRGEFAKCRNLKLEDIENNLKNNIQFVIRFNTSFYESLHNESVSICFDPVRGKIEFPANKLDVVLLKSDGIPTYHFAHAVDDHFMRTTSVVRGDEWLSSYPVHEQLFKAMEFSLPKFIHTAPIVKMDGTSKRKLSKRHDPEAAVLYYLEEGYPKESVIEYLMNIANSGFEEWRQKYPNDDISNFRFKIEKMPKAGALCDIVKLDSVSKDVISKFSILECVEKIKDWAKIYNEDLYNFANNFPKLFEESIPLWKGSGKRARKDVAKWRDLITNFGYIYSLKEDIKGYEFDSHLTSEKAKEFIKVYEQDINLSLEPTEWFEQMKAIGASLNYCLDMHEYKENSSSYKGSIADMCALLRIIITGKKDSPDLYTILKILGMDVIKKRFNDFQLTL